MAVVRTAREQAIHDNWHMHRICCPYICTDWHLLSASRHSITSLHRVLNAATRADTATRKGATFLRYQYGLSFAANATLWDMCRGDGVCGILKA